MVDGLDYGYHVITSVMLSSGLPVTQCLTGLSEVNSDQDSRTVLRYAIPNCGIEAINNKE
jgi:hypothetical protein